MLKICVSIITVPYLSRVLGSVSLGIYSYTYTIVSYFILFIIMGLDNYGNREVAKVKEHKELLNQVVSEIYFMQCVLGVLVICIYVIYLLFGVRRYKALAWVQGILLVSSLFDLNWALNGLEEFKFSAIRNSIFYVISLGCILFFVKNEDSVMIYAIILAILSILTNATGWFYVKKYIHFSKIKKKDALKHLKPNLILFIPIVAVSLYKMMDKIMMGMMCSMDQVGFYESAEKIIKIPTIFISSLGMVMLPRMTNLYSRGNEVDAHRYIDRSMDLSIIISTSMCFGIMGVSKEFVPLYYGDGYETCIALYIVLLPCCVFLAFSNVIRTQYLIPKGRDTNYITAVIVGASVNLLVNVLLIPQMGAIGAACGTFVAEITVCVTQTVGVYKELNVMKYALRSIPFLALGMGMFVLLFNIDFGLGSLLQLAVKVLIGIVLYCVGLLVIMSLGKNYYDIVWR